MFEMDAVAGVVGPDMVSDQPVVIVLDGGESSDKGGLAGVFPIPRAPGEYIFMV